MACKQTVSMTLDVLRQLIEQQEQHRQTREIFGVKGTENDGKSNAVLVDLYNEDFYKDLQKAREILSHYSIHVQGVEPDENASIEGSCLSDEKIKE